MEIDISKIKFNAHGLVPAIVQEESGQVLMLAYMNEESLKKTVETGYTHFRRNERKRSTSQGSLLRLRRRYSLGKSSSNGRGLSHGNLFLFQRASAGQK